jgi:hypothetical protein
MPPANSNHFIICVLSFSVLPFKCQITSHLLALLGAHHILHISSVRVNAHWLVYLILMKSFFLWEHHSRFRPFDSCPLFLECSHIIKQDLGIFCSVMLTASSQKAACYMSYLANSYREKWGVGRCILFNGAANCDGQAASVTWSKQHRALVELYWRGETDTQRNLWAGIS